MLNLGILLWVEEILALEERPPPSRRLSLTEKARFTPANNVLYWRWNITYFFSASDTYRIHQYNASGTKSDAASPWRQLCSMPRSMAPNPCSS